MRLMLQKPEGEVGASWPAIAIGLFVAFGGVLFGYVSQDWEKKVSILDFGYLLILIDMTPELSAVFWLCHTGRTSSQLDTEIAVVT
jgi:hypothetical protein